MPLIEDPIIAGASGGGSPSEIYLLFILSLCKSYFQSVNTLDPKQIDASTSALVAFVPDRATRTKIWGEYVKRKAEFEGTAAAGTLSSSVWTVGEVVSYLSEVMEFTTKSTGAFL